MLANILPLIILQIVCVKTLQNNSFQAEASHLIASFVKEMFPNCELIITWAYFQKGCDEHVVDNSFVSQELMVVPHAGAFTLNASRNFTEFRRFRDIHRMGVSGSCGVNVVWSGDSIQDDDIHLFRTLTPSYEPITRKDEDYFFFVSDTRARAERALLAAEFGNKIKFKMALYPDETKDETYAALTASLYEDRGNPLITPLTLPLNFFTMSYRNHDEKLHGAFPDFTRNLYGKPLRMSVAKVPFRIELETRQDGRLHPKRGFHTLWLAEAMKKFNFSYDIFVSSLGGGTGKQFKNGSWGGSVGDIFYGKADIAYQVAHIYNRHKFVEWAAPFTYEAIIFITHEPSTYFSPNAIYWPFTPSVWALFVMSLVLSGICFKLLALAYGKIHQVSSNGGNKVQSLWSNGRVLEYITATFLEQDRGGPTNMPFHPIRIFCAFWLLFALITATAYRAKLTTLMAFPLNTVVPETFEELVDSTFKAGLNVVGKGDAAYTIFSLGRGRVYEGLFSKMGIFPDAVECVMKSANEDFGCMIWDGYAEYIDAKNITDQHGRSPLQMSTTKTSFIEDGLIYEKRSVFRHHFDQTIRNSVNMGLSRQWLKMDLTAVKLKRTRWQKSVNQTIRVYHHDNGPVKLKMSHFTGSFLILKAGLLVSFIILLYESVQRQKLRANLFSWMKRNP